MHRNCSNNTESGINASALSGRFLLVSAEMGYGHHRAIYPLKDLSENGIILNINNSPNAAYGELRQWKEMLSTYEFMSRAGNFPVIGRFISKMLDNLLYIPKLYPVKDRSKSTFQVRYLKYRIKKGLCDGYLKHIRKSELPVITSFYAPAIASDMAGHASVYCIICDTDMNRVWVSEDASKSRIIYFASGTTSAQRLMSYGVPEKNILITGFPLPLDLLGNKELTTLKRNLHKRLRNLDPEEKFRNLYSSSISAYLPTEEINDNNVDTRFRCLTITYAVGGAGAQKETGKLIAASLAEEIINQKVKLNLVAGTRKELRDYYLKVKEEISLNSDHLNVIWADNINSYFELFNQHLHTTDILWTKPSELSFYCALGIPIIMSPAIGPQEKCNRRWLLEIGAGIKQHNPEYTSQWLFDLLKKGRIAEAAWNGFLKARKYGTFNILDFLSAGSFYSSNDPLKR